MPNPASNVTTTTEVGYCPFCGRTRNLRREERHLGGLVRATIDCESCHRTLSSTIGPPAPKAQPEPEAKAQPEAETRPKPEPVKASSRPDARKTAAKTAPSATKKPAAKGKTSTTTKKAATKKK